MADLGELGSSFCKPDSVEAGRSPQPADLVNFELTERLQAFDWRTSCFHRRLRRLRRLLLASGIFAALLASKS